MDQTIIEKLKWKGVEQEDLNWLTEYDTPEEAMSEACEERLGVVAKLLVPTAYADYKRIQEPAWADYLRIEEPAWADYLRIKEPAYADYLRIERAARMELLKHMMGAL